MLRAIDGTSVLRSRGAARFFGPLVPALARICESRGERLIVAEGSGNEIFDSAAATTVRLRGFLGLASRRFGWPTLERWTGAIASAQALGVDLPRVRRGTLRVITVADLSNVRASNAPDHARIRTAIARADLAICLGQRVATDLEEGFDFDADRCRVVAPGIDPEFTLARPERVLEIRERHALDQPYAILPLGDLNDRTTLDRSLVAYLRAFEDPEARPLLVVTVGSTSEVERVETIARDHEVVGSVRAVAPRGRDDDRALLTGARWGLCPFTPAGFDLPALDALSCGTPLLVARDSLMSEIVSDCGLAIDEENVDDIATGMIRLDRSPEFRKSMAERGLERARSEEFSWERAAQKIHAAYRGESVEAPGERSELRAEERAGH